MTIVKKDGALGRMLRPVRLDRPVTTSLARGGVYSTAGLVAQGLLRFVTSFLVGHIAGKTVLGEVASAIAMSLTLALLWPTTTGSAASMFIARARGEDKPDELLATAAHLRTRTMQTGLLLGAVGIPLWVLIDGGSWVGALSVSALTIAYSGYSFTRGVQFGAGQMQRATMWDITSVLVGLTALAVLLVAGVRSTALVVPLVLTYGLYTLVGWPYGARGKVGRERRRELDGFVVLGAIGSLASAGFLQLSQVAAKLAGGDVEAGQYASALALATPASMLATSLTLVLLPSLSEAFGRGDLDLYRAQTDRAARALAVTMVAIFCSVIVCSRLIISVVWGSTYAGAETLLPVLAAAVLVTNLGVAAVNALYTRSRRGLMINTSAGVGGMLVGVAVWLLLGPHLGTYGVAIGYLCGTLSIVVVPITWVWRKDGHRWGLMFAKVALGVAIAAGMVVVQHVAALPLVFDPVFAVGFVAVWWLLNRADVAKLPIPGLRRR